MPIRLKLTLCVVALITLVTGCQTPKTTAGSATADAICVAWRDSLPSRSAADTPETIAEIGLAYDVFLAACKGFALPWQKG